MNKALRRRGRSNIFSRREERESGCCASSRCTGIFYLSVASCYLVAVAARIVGCYVVEEYRTNRGANLGKKSDVWLLGVV